MAALPGPSGQSPACLQQGRQSWLAPSWRGLPFNYQALVTTGVTCCFF